MVTGIVSEGFLIVQPEIFPLVLHGLLWYFPDIQAKHGGGFMTLLIFLDITPLLDNLRRYLNYQWFNLWCQTRSSLYYRPKMSSVNHSLAISSLISSATNISLYTSSKLVEIWDGILVGVMRSSPASRISYCPLIRISRCTPRNPPCCATLGWQIWVDLTQSGISRCFLGIGYPCNPPSWAQKFLIGHHIWVLRLIPAYFLFNVGLVSIIWISSSSTGDVLLGSANTIGIYRTVKWVFVCLPENQVDDSWDYSFFSYKLITSIERLLAV